MRIHLQDVELSEPLAPLRAPRGGYERALLLVRLHGEPLGQVDVPLTAGAADVATVAERVLARLHDRIDAHLAGDGLPPVTDLPVPPPADAADPRPACERERARLRAAAPFASVVVCTRDRAVRLARALPAVLAQDHPRFEVLVVDNAPRTDEAERFVRERYGDDARVRYVGAPRPGLAAARNVGLRTALADHVAFLDDDEVPDRGWLSALLRGFVAAPDVAAVSGPILPAALETEAHLALERGGGHSKGRGFERAVFDQASHARQSPLFPSPPFGAGGNMAFRRPDLLDVGGFDEALGAGTPVRGAEDTAAFYDLMRRGRTVVFEPSAFVRHEHHDDLAALRRQLYGYGVGLGAFYTRAVLREPGVALELARLAPRGLRELVGGEAAGGGVAARGQPPGTTWAKLVGMTVGPFALLVSRWRLLFVQEPQ